MTGRDQREAGRFFQVAGWGPLVLVAVSEGRWLLGLLVLCAAACIERGARLRHTATHSKPGPSK